MKKNKFLMGGIAIFSVIMFFGILWAFINEPLQNYNDKKQQRADTTLELEAKRQNYEALQKKNSEEEMKLKSIKQMYTSENSNASDLSAFGPMFNDIISSVQSNGLIIRSIEYKMNPVNDAISADNPDAFNACELKFFLVGSYAQLRNFLNYVVTDYNYLVSLSNLEVTAFPGDTDYLLANISIILYAKKEIK